MKYLLVAVLVLSASSASIDAFAEQKIIFCGETISYRKYDQSDSVGDVYCSAACKSEPDCNRDGLLSEGWKIDITMPKSKRMTATQRFSFLGSCTLNGTQYVMSKAEMKVTQETDKNIELLKKEIELLKKENEILKQENDALKSKKKK